MRNDLIYLPHSDSGSLQHTEECVKSYITEINEVSLYNELLARCVCAEETKPCKQKSNAAPTKYVHVSACLSSYL